MGVGDGVAVAAGVTGAGTTCGVIDSGATATDSLPSVFVDGARLSRNEVLRRLAAAEVSATRRR